MTQADLRGKFLDQVKLEVPFSGWTKQMLFAVESKLSLEKNYHLLLFPGELKEIVTLFEADLDNYMIRTFKKQFSGKEMKIRDKVKEAIKIRFIGPNKDNKILLSKLYHFYFNFNNFSLGYKNFWHSVDQIWYLAGDEATDFNYYTKRGLLFIVYKSSFIYYINSSTDESAWKFLDGRIDNVMKISKIKKIPETLKKLKDKIPFCRLKNKI